VTIDFRRRRGLYFHSWEKALIEEGQAIAGVNPNQFSVQTEKQWTEKKYLSQKKKRRRCSRERVLLRCRTWEERREKLDAHRWGETRTGLEYEELWYLLSVDFDQKGGSRRPLERTLERGAEMYRRRGPGNVAQKSSGGDNRPGREG